MLVGYNTNVSYKGDLYHIQTEDSGLKNPVITTLLYLKGTILSSKKINYSYITVLPDYKEKIKEIMKEQHKNMIKELVSGKYNSEPPLSPDEKTDHVKLAGNPEKPPSPKSQITKSIDDILLDNILKEEK